MEETQEFISTKSEKSAKDSLPKLNLKGVNIKTNEGILPTNPLPKEEKIMKILANVTKRIQTSHNKEIVIKVKKALQEFLEKVQILNENESRKSPHELCDISVITKNYKIVNISNITMSYEHPQCITEDDNKENHTNPNIFISEKSEISNNSKYLSELQKSQFLYESLTNDQKDTYNKLITMIGEIRPNDEHLLEKFDIMMILMEKMNMDTLQACQEPILQSIFTIVKNNSNERKSLQQFLDQLTFFLTKMNRICLEITPKTLYIELKLMFLYIGSNGSTKNIERILDSAYMTCSINKFLGVSIKIFEKIDEKYARLFQDDRLANTLKFYISWLCQKLEKIQNCIVDETSIKQFKRIYTSFEFVNFKQIHQPLIIAISKKVKLLDESSSGGGFSSSRSFDTPKIKKKNKSSDSIDNDNNESILFHMKIRAVLLFIILNNLHCID